MFRIGSYIFRNAESLGEYLKVHKGKTFVVEYITEYMLNDPMEQ
jgi:ribosomal protein S19